MPIALWLVAGALVVLYAVGIAMAVDAIWNTRTAQGTLAWVFALIVFAPVAVPFYFVFGTRRFHGYVRAMRRGNQRIHKLAREVHGRLSEHSAEAIIDTPSLDFLGLLPLTSGNSAKLLIDGSATFDAIFAAIDRAEKYILVQFYIINDDATGRALLDRLAAAAKRGVACSLLYDEVGSKHITKRYLRDAQAAGIVVSGFRTTKGPKNRFQINFRNHRKIVVVDGRIAFVGGHNVGDEYLGKHRKLSPWRDTHIELRGPCVQAVQLSFVEDWHWATHNVPELEWAPRREQGCDERVMIVPSGPADDVETFSLLVLWMIGRAKSRLWIATPYFVPDEASLAALQLAALRGVDVRVIIPDRSDFALAYWAAYSYYPDVLPAKIKLYRYGDGFMHQKVIVSDEVACVGTGNLDNRSLRINFEVSAVVADSTVAEDVIAMLERDLSKCKRVDAQAWSRLTVRHRLRARFARLLAPIL